MSVPSPAKALDGRCAVIDNEQLYVLSSTAFQSIALKEGAQWNEEATGELVIGSACTKVVPQGDESQAAMYVIGGTSSDSSYSGLQRYFFGNKTWETLSPPADVMQNRLNHTAAYIPDSNKILVYAGSPADTPTWLSSQTFTILTQPPYTIDSYSAKGHTANVPIVETWNATHAMMTGGSLIDTSVFLFDTTNGWSQYPTSLQNPVGGAKGFLINGTDGSKILQTYDLTSSTNEITSTVLQDANGQPAQNGEILGSSSSKRDLSVQGWSSYNGTGAPSTTTSDYAIAQDGQGLVALAGASSSQSVYLFNQTNNGWVDPVKFFNGDNQTPLQATSSAASASSTAAATSTSAASSSSNTGSVAQSSVDDAASRQHSILIEEIGIIVGICGGFALIFVIALLVMRWRRKQRAKHNGPLDGNEGGRMSFADRGASFMKEAEGSNKPHPFFPTADRYSLSTTPVPTMAPRGTSRYGKRGYSGHQQTGSFESTKELVEKEQPVEMAAFTQKASSPIIRKPAPAYHSEKVFVEGPVEPTDEEKERRKRSSGWSRYFSTSQPTTEEGLSHLPSAYRSKNPPSDGSLYAKDSAYTSVYADPPLPALPVHIPATNFIAPLNIDFSKTIDGQRLSKVASSNPTYRNSSDDLAKRGSAIVPSHARIESSEQLRPPSTNTVSSYNDRATISSTTASEYYASNAQEAWTPMTMHTSFKEHINNTSNSAANSRPTSSLYTTSVYGDRPYSRGRGQGASFFPGAGTSKQSTKSAKTKSSYSAAPSAEWASVKDENRENKMSGASAFTVFPEPSGESYSATARNPSQKSTKSTKSTKSAKSTKDGSGMAGLSAAANNTDRSSNMTLFPKPVVAKQPPALPSMIDAKDKKALNTDVSWVNLNSDAR